MKKLIILSGLVIYSLGLSAREIPGGFSGLDNTIKKTTFGKYRTEKDPNQLNKALIIGGGLSITIAGFLTPPTYTEKSTGGYNVQRVPVPFYQQGPRFGGIVGGITVTFGGLISLIAK